MEKQVQEAKKKVTALQQEVVRDIKTAEEQLMGLRMKYQQTLGMVEIIRALEEKAFTEEGSSKLIPIPSSKKNAPEGSK